MPNSLKEYEKELMENQIKLDEVIKVSVEKNIREIIHILNNVLSDEFFYSDFECKKEKVKRLFRKPTNLIQTVKNDVYYITLRHSSKNEKDYLLKLSIHDNMKGFKNERSYKITIEEGDGFCIYEENCFNTKILSILDTATHL